MYKYILMDADGTIFDFDKSERKSFLNTLAEFGISGKSEYATIYHDVNKKCWELLEKKMISREELLYRRFEETFENIGLNLDPHAFWRKYEHNLSKCADMICDAEEVCTQLSKKYDIYVITNGLKNVQEGRFKACSYINHSIRELFISENIGTEKPDKAFFDCVLNKIKASADECLVVGDSITSDIKGANNAGIDACFYNPNNKKIPSDIEVKYEIQTLKAIFQVLPEG